jgi:hypothetical protein
MESKLLRPNPDHSPSIERDDANHDRVKHVLGAQAETLLDGPESEDAHELGDNPDDEKVRERQRIIGHNAVLKGRNHSDSRVETVAKEEITD